jgi:diguanylate cyclase (GGDEF)-like protein
MSNFTEPSPDVEREAERIATLNSLMIMDTAPELEFDTIVTTAQRLLGCKIALISLVDRERQWFKAKRGIVVEETPRAMAFCAKAVESDDGLVVADATKDSRFSDNPLVTDEPHIRFYAGIPIRAKSMTNDAVSLPMGTLCVIDDQPRVVGQDEVAILKQLAGLVEVLMETRRLALSAARIAEERSAALEVVKRQERQFRQAEHMANIGSWRYTLADQRLEWSDQIYAMHGVPVEKEPVPGSLLKFYPPGSRELLWNAIEHTISTGESFDFEIDFVTAQGHPRRGRSKGDLELKDGKPVAIIGAFQDITEQHLMALQLTETAYTDEVTGIASRALFNSRIAQAVTMARHNGSPLALLYIDLDRFKQVNDRLGHAAGDDLLREMARKLEARYLAGSFAARLGGDEFVLLVNDPALIQDLRRVIAMLLSDLRRTVEGGGSAIAVSATIGACRLNASIRDHAELQKLADIALYEAKRRKRGSAIISGEEGLILPNLPPLRLVAG